VARGQVIRPGRTLTVTRGEIFSADGTHVASMQQTLMMLADTPDTSA
jgi:acyl-coenzyme A thioesterase PaaI-like protein